MAKTVKDYMNDPRILEDSGIMAAPEYIREIHAIRLKIQDEHDVFSPAYDEQCRKTTGAFFREKDVSPRYTNLSPAKATVFQLEAQKENDALWKK